MIRESYPWDRILIRLIVISAIGMLVVIALVVIDLPRSVEKVVYAFAWTAVFVSGLLYTLLSVNKAMWLWRKLNEKKGGKDAKGH